MLPAFGLVGGIFPFQPETRPRRRRHPRGCRSGSSWYSTRARSIGCLPARIKSLEELKGGKQIVRVQAFGAALDQMTRDLRPSAASIRKKTWCCAPSRPTPARLAALMGGAVDAAVVNQMDRITQEKGFNELLFYGDDLSFVTAGAVTTENFWLSARIRATISPRPLKGFHC